jgi:hypothetical protein
MGQYYAGGGGGSGRYGLGTGGIGGGGNAASSNTVSRNGAASYGGGGGCGRYVVGGNGGSGVAVFKIPDTYSATCTNDMTLYANTNGYKYYQITQVGQNGTITFTYP